MISQPSVHSTSGGSGGSLFASQIIKFVILGLGCVFSIFIAVQVTDPDVNGLAAFMRYVSVGCFAFAVVSPRASIYLLLFLCPVLDLIKRTLILFDNVNMVDVATVLAVAPITLAGTVSGLLFARFIFRRQAPIEGEKKLFILLLAITSLVVLSNVLHNEGSKMTLLHALSESCIYIFLILLIPIYFPTTEEIATLMRCCVVVFVPVALYGFWQKAFGLSDFEWRYLLSGLTITAEDYIGSERVFSTLNSNHSFSVTMAACAVISLLQRSLPSAGGWQSKIKWHGTILFLLYCGATLVSLRRTGWLLVAFSLAGAFCFRSRLRTFVFYTVCVVGGLLIIFNADYIYTKLPVWEITLQESIPGYDSAFQLQTFNDRLESFRNLTGNPAIWTLFGLPPGGGDAVYAHDAISETLVSYGAVGLLSFVGVLVGILSISHRLVWKATKTSERSYAALLLSFVFANLFVGSLLQSHINIFPINVIFWMCTGALLKITFQQQAIVEEPGKTDVMTLVEASRARQSSGALTPLFLPNR